jgi:hypothetical protein
LVHGAFACAGSARTFSISAAETVDQAGLKLKEELAKIMEQ